MAISFVRNVGTYFDGTTGLATMVVTVPAATTIPVGDTLLLAAEHNSSVGATVSIADSKGNTWNVDSHQNPGTNNVVLASGTVSTQLVTGDTITLTLSGTCTRRAMAVAQFTGLEPVTDLDKTGTATATGTALSVSASADTTTADELIVAAFGTSLGANADSGFAAGAGYTALSGVDTNQGTSNRGIDWEYKIVSATGPQTATATITPSVLWLAAMGTYRALAAAPPPASGAVTRSLMGVGL